MPNPRSRAPVRIQPILFDEPQQSVPAVRGWADLSGAYRWRLGREWNPGKSVCWIMLNPSTADHETDDPTIRRCIKFSRRWGYGKLVVVNLYPYRSPNPADCRRWADWENNGPDWYARDALWRNEDVIAKAAKSADLVVAAWGAIAWDEMWVEQIAEAITGGTEPWPSIYCLGTTGSGAPKHPMGRGVHRVPDDATPILWRVGAPARDNNG